MKLTKTERAMLANQNRILAFLDEDNSDNYLIKAQIAERGFEGLYDRLFEHIYEGVSEDVCMETHNILTMYRVINNCIETLTPEEKNNLDLNSIKFTGFDANNDDHYFFMKFIVNEVNLYEEYKNVNLNSHSMSSLGKYRKMLPIYRRAIETNHYQLNLSGLRAIIASV